jgi:hypothetical protein
LRTKIVPRFKTSDSGGDQWCERTPSHTSCLGCFRSCLTARRTIHRATRSLGPPPHRFPFARGRQSTRSGWMIGDPGFSIVSIFILSLPCRRPIGADAFERQTGPRQFWSATSPRGLTNYTQGTGPSCCGTISPSSLGQWQANKGA